MTEEELLNSFLNSPATADITDVTVEDGSVIPQDDTGDKESALLAQFLDSGDEVSTPPPVAAPRKPRVLEKTVESLRQGISDGISAFMGDSYGRGSADDLERTPTPLYMRPFAAGAEVVRGTGEAVGDLISRADSVVGSPLEKSMRAGASNLEEHPIYSKAGPEQAMIDLEEEFPEAHDDIADVGVVLSAALPYAKAAKMNAGKNWQKSRVNRKQKLREQDIEARLIPDDIYGGPGKVTEEGLLKTDTFHPNKKRQVLYDDVDTVKGLNPRESPGNNWNALDDEVGTLRTHLDRRLKYANYESTAELKSAVEQSILAIEGLPVMKGSTASAAAKAVYEQVEKIIDKYEVNGGIKPGAMLDARRELDNWLKMGDSKVFEGQSLSGTTLAVQAVRRAINEQVAKVAPHADVGEALRKQSSLLTARDELLVKANRQGKNRLTRAIQETQEKMGLALPHSPAAVGANLQLGPLLLGGGATALTHGGRGISNLGSFTGAGLTRTLQELYNPTRGAIPSALLQEEEE